MKIINMSVYHTLHVFEPEILEEMANDPAAKEKYMGIIDDSTEKLNSIKDKMTDEEKADIKIWGFPSVRTEPYPSSPRWKRRGMLQGNG